MSMADKVTLHDILELNQSIDQKLDKLGERVSSLEIWRAEIMGKLVVFVAFVSLGATVTWEYIKSKFFKT